MKPADTARIKAQERIDRRAKEQQSALQTTEAGARAITLDERLSTAEQKIEDALGAIDVAAGAISTLQARIDRIEESSANVAALDRRVNSIEEQLGITSTEQVQPSSPTENQ